MPENTSRVNVHSKLTQVSSSPVGPGKIHPLSPLDHAMGLHSLHVVFYYAKNPFGNFDFSPMRTALSEVLSLYPPITGRLHRDGNGNWVVNCNDAGVRVIRASVRATVDEWLKSACGSEERELAVWNDMPEDPSTWSPFRIQISDFEGGGVAIGLSCSHMHMDPACATLLLKSWTEACRGEAITFVPSFQPDRLRGQPNPSTQMKSLNQDAKKAKAETPFVKMATRSFRFSSSTMKQRLLQLHSKCPDATPFDFLAALFWTSIARVKASTHDRTQSISLCVDFRKLLNPPLPKGYFGNALYFSSLTLSEEDIEHDGLEHVVELVHNHVSGLKEEEVRFVIDWFESNKGEGTKFASPFRMYGPELTCVNMEHMIASNSLPYAAEFKKDEKPVHVAYHVGNADGEGLIWVMPSPEEGLARTVTVTLPEEEMIKLCQDQAILNLEPTLMFNGLW